MRRIRHPARSVVRSARRASDALVTARRAAGDLLAVLAAFATAGVLAWSVGQGSVRPDTPPLIASLEAGLMFAVFCLPTFWWLGLYRPRASVLNLWELSTAARGVSIAAGWFMATYLLLPHPPVGPSTLLVGLGASLFFLLCERRLVAGVLRRLQVRGRLGRRVLIYGCGPTGRRIMKKLLEAPAMSRTVVGFLDDTAPIGSPVECRVNQTTLASARYQVLGRLRDLADIVSRQRVDELLIDGSVASPADLDGLLAEADALGVDVGIVPELGDIPLDRLALEDFSAVPLLRPRRARSRRAYAIVKRAMDLAGASLLLLSSAPIWALIAALIRLDSPGPIFFRQTRVGRDGATFDMLKFRSMFVHVPAYADSPVGDATDPRITRVGRLLRLSGLDELPQLVNVLRGEMSLVGPRPEMPFIVDRYDEIQRGRLRAPPGITGVWQLSPDRHVQIHESIEYDLYYIQHRTVGLDLLLLLDTVFHTFGAAASRAWSGLSRRRRSALDGVVRSAIRPLERNASMRPGVRGNRVREAAIPPPATAGAPDGSRRHVLVALDPRDAPDRAHLLLLLRAAHAISCRWPVTIATGERHRWAFQMLLDEVGHRCGSRDPDVWISAAWGRDEIAALSRDALLVWTDVPDVVGWVREHDVDVLLTGGESPRIKTSTPAGRRIAIELVRWLQPRVPDGTAARPVSMPEPRDAETATRRDEPTPIPLERSEPCPQPERWSPAPAGSLATTSSTT